jgi:hypothetical protein
MDTPIKRLASWRWLVLIAAMTLVGSVLVALMASRFSDADTDAAVSIATDVCCGGVDCPKEQQRAEGTSCENACRSCKSGRKRVSGACGEPIPPTNTYRLRLAGATIPGYVPGKTDTICVQRAGAAPVCAMVSDTMTSPLLGLVRMADLTTDPGMDVWFDRGKTRMRSSRGIRVQRTTSQFTNHALCVGAVLYSADESEIVRFYLEDP